MRKKFATSIISFTAACLMAFGSVLMPVASVAATPANNGTLKVHEIGTPSGTENNDPKVCAFNLEGFNFDASQSGYINIDTQGGSSPVGMSAGPFNFGPTNTSGFAVTQDFNKGGVTIVNGTYKATLYGKDTGGNIDLKDEKAKSKVFKVECLTSVTPAEVTFDDQCGTENDTYTIPSMIGVIYKVGGVTKDTNTYVGSGSVTVTATAASDYELTETTSWSTTFTNAVCPSVIELPSSPTTTDPCGVENAAWNLPLDTEVLNWEIDGDGHLTATIIPTGVTFSNGTTTHDFGVAIETNTENCPSNEIQIPAQPSVTDLCGAENASWIIPQNSEELSWNLDKNGHLIVTIIAVDTVFPDGTTAHDFGTVTETNTTVCPEEPCEQDAVSILRNLAINQNEIDDECEEPEVEDVCINIDGVQTQVPETMTVDEDGNCSTPEVLAETTPTPQQEVLSSNLANTGTPVITSLIMGLFLIVSTVALSAYQRKNSVNL